MASNPKLWVRNVSLLQWRRWNDHGRLLLIPAHPQHYMFGPSIYLQCSCLVTSCQVDRGSPQAGTMLTEATIQFVTAVAAAAAAEAQKMTVSGALVTRRRRHISRCVCCVKALTTAPAQLHRPRRTDRSISPTPRNPRTLWSIARASSMALLSSNEASLQPPHTRVTCFIDAF